jgi:hypothetical protein
MRDSVIRHLAICDESPIIAAAFFESVVQIWSWKTGQKLGEFESILDFGGSRLALSRTGKFCITGSWRKGLAAYTTPDGGVLWHRKDIRQVQRIALSTSGREVYCGIESSKVLIINAETGETLKEIRRASSIVPSQAGPHELVVRRGDRYVVRGSNEQEIPAISFALLSAAFSPGSVCISEPKTGSRCIDLASGQQLWHHETMGANHVAYNTSDRRFYCIAVADIPPHNRSLVRLSRDLLECERVLALGPCWEDAFSPSGTLLVTKDGDVWETSSGNLIVHLDFPQRDYPDS